MSKPHVKIQFEGHNYILETAYEKILAGYKGELNQALARLEKAKAALEFYANGDYSTCEAVGDYHSPMDEEGGKRAQQALKDLASE